jgi:hypothetical protein
MENENDKNEGMLREDENTGVDRTLNDNTDISSSKSPLTTPPMKEKGISFLLRYLLMVFALLLTFILLFAFVLYLAPNLQEISSGRKSKISASSEFKKDADYKKQIVRMSKEIQRLSRKYSTYTSGQSYIVINTTDNKFFLYKNKMLVREGLCSSGANKMLQTEKKTYLFKTPKGKFSITGKRKHPYWHRSDWDFIEQGLPVPPKDHPSRWEEGVLGDYALDLVDGYMIHGTIYKRLMGMPVTHGCVRLGDKDLEIVFNTLNIGSKVYIF